MARIRSVHPDICEDEILAEVSPYAERTFVRLWTHLDDKGRGKDNAILLVAQLYPLHREMTAERVEKDLCELAQAGLLQRYTVDGKKYLCAKPEAWSKYQKPKHPTPSKLPPHPQEELDGGSPTPGLPQDSPASLHGGGDGEEWSRRQEGESEGEADAPSPDAQVVDISRRGRELSARASRFTTGGSA